MKKIIRQLRLYLCLTLVLYPLLVSSHTWDYFVSTDETRNLKTGIDHRIFDGLLKKHVAEDGRVNYKAFKQDEDILDEYLSLLSSASQVDGMDRPGKMAFWINAYNAFTIKLILENYPLKSIMDLDNGKVWDRKWINVAGRNYSLNDIEHQILRPEFKDSRVHFAINCAAKSCPMLWNRAWTTGNLEEALDSQTAKFINNSKFNLLKPKRLQLSRIFQWYADDFADLIDFLNRYSDIRIQQNAKISYKEYNWGLNQDE